MNSKFCFVFLLIFCSGVQSASILETSYNYVINFGKSLAPNVLSILECVGQEEPWGCAREKAGKMLDIWGEDVEKERRIWEEEADAEVRSSGRSLEEMPSKLGREITDSLGSLANIIERGVARALEPKKHDQGGIDSITISTGGGDKKKIKKKKPKPPKIHLIHPMMVHMKKAHKEEKGRNFGNGIQSWVIGERDLPEGNTEGQDEGLETEVEESEGDQGTESGVIAPEAGRGVVSDLWAMGQEALDSVAEHVVENENLENGVQDRSSFEEQRGKKKKKKKAILKLLVLGAVIKAKIATILQILTYKLQVKFFILAVANLAINAIRLWYDIKNNKSTSEPPQKIKFFIIALLSLAVNLARLIIDIKNKHNAQPQKIIYYEHAQHQHHYDHEEEEPHGWGPWSRSLFPTDETETEGSEESSPYRAQERVPVIYSRPYPSRV